MPTLGFLKKKRTKDSFGSKDLDSPTSPIKENIQNQTQPAAISSPTAPTSAAANTAPNSAVKKPSTEYKPHDSAAEFAASTAQHPSGQEDPAMTSAPSYPSSSSPAAQTPSIQNMLNSNSHANGGAIPGALPTQQPSTIIRETKGKYALADFDIQRTLGTGSFGRVHLVQSKHNQRYYAIKVLKKAQVVKMKQVEHTNDERRMLQKVKHPFLITLWGTFQDSKNLYMVMDFIEGGELFSLLRKSQVSAAHVLRVTELLTYVSAISKSGCQILRRRSNACARLPSFHEHHLSGFEARKLASG